MRPKATKRFHSTASQGALEDASLIGVTRNKRNFVRILTSLLVKASTYGRLTPAARGF